MRLSILLTAIVLASALDINEAQAQPPTFYRYSNTDFTIDLVDAGDNFYVRSIGGLVKYDKFTRKSTVYSNITGIDNNNTWAMAVDEQERLWLGTAEGLLRFDGAIQEKHPINLPNGAVPSNIAAIEPDGHGGFWIASNNGGLTVAISHFDGANWKHFTQDNGLPEGWFSTLLVLSPDEVWFVGTGYVPYETNAGHIRDGKITIYSSKDGLPTSEGHAITRDSTGRIWVGSGYVWESRLTVFENNTWRSIQPSTLPLQNAIYSMVTAPDGSVWACGLDAVSRFSSGQWTSFKATEVAGNSFFRVAISRLGTVWVATDGGAAFFQDGKWNALSHPQILSANFVTCLRADSRGDILIGTNAAVDRKTSENWVSYFTPNEPRRGVEQVSRDKFGNIWTVSAPLSAYRGISKWDGTTWDHITLKDHGITSDTIHDLARGTDGTMWFGATGGLVHFDGTDWKAFTIDDSLRPWRQFHHIAVDSSGNIWAYSQSQVFRYVQGNFTVASMYMQLHKFDGVNWTTFVGDANIRIPESIGGLEIDRKGNLWYYSDSYNDPDRAFWKFDGVSTEEFEIPDATGKLRKANLPHDIAIDKDDNIWFAIPWMIENSHMFDGQLSKFESSGSWKHYTSKSGGFPCLPSYETQPIALDFMPNGDLWIGTRSVGVVRMRNEQFEAFSVNDGMISNEVTHVGAASNGSVWTINIGLEMFNGLTQLRFNPLTNNVTSSNNAAHPSAYPNPFSEQTTVTLSFTSSGFVDVKLTDQLGRTVRQLPSSQYVSGEKLSISVDRDGLANGVYYVHATLNSGEYSTTKIILQ